MGPAAIAALVLAVSGFFGSVWLAWAPCEVGACADQQRDDAFIDESLVVYSPAANWAEPAAPGAVVTPGAAAAPGAAVASVDAPAAPDRAEPAPAADNAPQPIVVARLETATEAAAPPLNEDSPGPTQPEVVGPPPAGQSEAQASQAPAAVDAVEEVVDVNPPVEENAKIVPPVEENAKVTPPAEEATKIAPPVEENIKVAAIVAEPTAEAPSVNAPQPQIAAAPASPPSIAAAVSKEKTAGDDESGAQDARALDEVAQKATAAAAAAEVVVASAKKDLSGTWELRNAIDTTTYRPYLGLRLAYRIRIEQHGTKIVGTGEKLSENGRTLPQAERTPIFLEGDIEGQTVKLTFSEKYAGGSTGGTISWQLAPTGHMSGRFASNAAKSSGISSARRLSSR